MKRKYKSRVTSDEIRKVAGSALILTVVLTSLLAIVGVLFVMMSRVDKIATSAVSESRELNSAIDTIIAKISEELILDVPGVDGAEYYDYPGSQDKWLASLEPYSSGDDYYWRQISDITGFLTGYTTDIRAKVLPEYAPILITDFNQPVADADSDGDGVGDSKWFKLDDITSSKGKPIYAAVRIIDNGGMLNVNTAYKFDPIGIREMVDGTSQLQINLIALADRPGYPSTASDETDLLKARANDGNGIDYLDLNSYKRDVIWRYSEPNGLYTPFDISDELELRYRFLLNNTSIDARLEEWGVEFRRNTLSTPVATGGQELDSWFKRAYDVGTVDPNYAYRHIATTYNMDRIIDPNGTKMVNINTTRLDKIYEALLNGLDSADREEIAAQLAVNIVDFRDSPTGVGININYDPGERVTVFDPPPDGGRLYYGFEIQPFISEIAFRISDSNPTNSANNYFAIELYNPFDRNIPLGDFRLELRLNNAVVDTINLTGRAIAANSRFVITNSSAASSVFGVADLISIGGGKEDDDLVLAKYIPVLGSDPPIYALGEKFDVYLLRTVSEPDLARGSGTDIYLDRQKTEDAWFAWNSAKGTSRFYCRSDVNWNIVYQELQPTANTLGVSNRVAASGKNYNLENFGELFVTIGDIAKVLTFGPSIDPNDMIGVRLAAEPSEDHIRLDLKDPVFADIFQYMTVIDPETIGLGAGEMRIKGRINVNTAPWFVIVQLPWMRPDIARAIVAYRDTTTSGFKSSAELMQVNQMDYYATDPADLTTFPDLTPNDGVGQDFEERDVIFSRISDLVTVRSDVFTAYILVRIGTNGPQKRVLAILDRSKVRSRTGKVRVVALQPISDPR
jgi:hypothetical protein